MEAPYIFSSVEETILDLGLTHYPEIHQLQLQRHSLSTGMSRGALGGRKEVGLHRDCGAALGYLPRFRAERGL